MTIKRDKRKTKSENPQKSFEIKICQKIYSSRAYLRRHIEIVHKKQINFECEVCGMKFSQNCHLTRHIQAVHDKIKDFKCDLCDYKAAKKADLQRHIISHTNPNFKPKPPQDTSNPNRPFKCDIEKCGKYFRTKSKLNFHKKTHSGKFQSLILA